MARPTAGAPRVSVVMPVYDGAAFLAEAIESVLAQTLSDFELVVVDDGSRDDSGAIAARYADDPRVRILSLPHRGLASALNAGLEEARGEYVARADGDDVNLPQRLARQVAALDAAPGVGVCGSWIAMYDSGEVWRLPGDGARLRCAVLFEMPFFHPTVMLRRGWLRWTGCGYDPAFENAEDCDLWERVADRTEFANVPEALVRYRRHPAQVSVRQAGAQSDGARRVRERAVARLGLRPSAEELRLHEAMASFAPFDRRDLPAARGWLDALERANRSCGRFPPAAFASYLAFRDAAACARLPQGAGRCAWEMARSPRIRAHPWIWPGAARLLMRKHPQLTRVLRPRIRGAAASSKLQR